MSGPSASASFISATSISSTTSINSTPPINFTSISTSTCISRSDLTIFISIASYRDSETAFTLESLYSKCSNSSRIYVGIVWQYNPLNDSNLLFNQLQLQLQLQQQSSTSHSHLYPDQNIKQLYLPYTSASGPVYARSLAETLYSGQHFYLQIDSHMRFIRQFCF